MKWHKTAIELQQEVRAYNPVPGAFFNFDDERVKCWSAQDDVGQSAAVGTVLSAGRGGINVACGNGTLRMLELQRPGRRKISAGEFADQMSIRGKRLN